LKYLIFSDVHGNLEALEAVLAHGASAGAESYICLGDIIGYGADPNECVEAVRALPACACVKGNHDAAVVDPRERSFFHSVALEGVRFTEATLTEENRKFIESLPYVYSSNGLFIAVHASPYRPEAWEYVLDQGGAKRAFGATNHRIAFIGHSHTPVVFRDDGRAERFLPGERLDIEDGIRYVVNVGSVGQPRDGNPDASFLMFDDRELTAVITRVAYDRKKAAEKILKAGLPPVLAERLLVGY
jgi:diadenosine tetraphosphatase ApaH/serine/threonine PP2A family protein phosphatase